MSAKNYPSVLNVLRNRHGLTQRQLGDKAGVSQSVVSFVENDTQPVLASSEAAIANVLGFNGHPGDLRESYEEWSSNGVANLSSVPLEIVRIDPEIMSGEPCFPGTRVTVQTLVDYLKAGDSLEYFLIQHPTVSREQAQDFIQVAANIAVSQVKIAA